MPQAMSDMVEKTLQVTTEPLSEGGGCKSHPGIKGILLRPKVGSCIESRFHRKVGWAQYPPRVRFHRKVGRNQSAAVAASRRAVDTGRVDSTARWVDPAPPTIPTLHI